VAKPVCGCVFLEGEKIGTFSNYFFGVYLGFGLMCDPERITRS
jgi:hypothetical protein